jgi:hypothetical protein
MTKEKQTPFDELLPTQGQSYLSHLIAKYRALVMTDSSPYKSDEDLVRETLKKETSPLTWGDLLTFEMAVLKSMPLEALRREAYTLRERYLNVAGLKTYENYLRSKPPDPGDENIPEKDLRADVFNLLGKLHWLYASTPERERHRNRLAKWSTLIPSLLLGIITVSLVPTFKVGGKNLDLPTFFLVLFAGAMGGFISMQRRLQSTSREGDPLDNLTNMANGWFSLFLAPISGGFFALVLYMIFIAHLIEGTIFPHIVSPCAAEKGLPFKDFAECTGAASGGDFAKLMVWSFIAGFAERFVPDTLDRLTAKKETNKGD